MKGDSDDAAETGGRSSGPLRDEIAGAVRVPLRTAAFVGVTFGMYGLLELETARAPAADAPEILARWVGRYGNALLRLYGVEAIARGAHIGEGVRYPGRSESGRGRIFVMNHRSGLDIPITLAFFDATIVSRSDLARWPVIGLAARRAGTLFVDRSSKSSGATVITAMHNAVKSGRGVMVYPEGTTYAGDEVRPFRPGAFLVAERADAEIVPVGVAYAGEALTFGEEPFLAHLRRVSSLARTRLGIVAGDPILSNGEGVESLQKRAHEEVQRLVHEARKLVH